ncbi:MAG: sporulation initiation factor Spo0A C-terminal domain-containing protein [Oscillospiraceae bacterium]|nr:sporulation initiation factor Spo0A C-terminal domain-containing protein [Oscillospiraceae bacterium]
MIKKIILSIEIREEQIREFQEAIMQLEKQFNIAIGLDLVEKDNNKLVLDSYLSDLFASLGMSASLSGYNYLKSAINFVINDSTYLQRGITSRLYPDVASIFKTKPHCVERAVRHAITTVWNNGNFALLEKNFGSCISASTGKPTNSAFIARTVEIARKEVAQDSSPISHS